jgi:hypothetical protein
MAAATQCLGTLAKSGTAIRRMPAQRSDNNGPKLAIHHKRLPEAAPSFADELGRNRALSADYGRLFP